MIIISQHSTDIMAIYTRLTEQKPTPFFYTVPFRILNLIDYNKKWLNAYTILVRRRKCKWINEHAISG